MPQKGGVLGMFNWDETLGEDPVHAGKIVPWLAWKHLDIFPEKLEEEAGERDVWVWASICCTHDLTLGLVADDVWMEASSL